MDFSKPSDYQIASEGRTVDLQGLDKEGQVNAILKAVGTVEFSIDGFTAIYLISMIQSALSHPQYIDQLRPTQQVEAFAKGLTKEIAGKHPTLREMINSGWEGVSLCREAYQRIKNAPPLTREDLEAKPLKELKDKAKKLKVKGWYRMKKSVLIDRILAIRNA